MLKLTNKFKILNFKKLVLSLLALPVLGGALISSPQTNKTNHTSNSTQTTSLQSKPNSLQTNSFSKTFSDHPEGGWQAKENELDPIRFDYYTEVWHHVTNIIFLDNKAIIYTILNDGTENKLTYKKPNQLNYFAYKHFNHIQKDWYDFTKNRKPSYTNYFLIKFGLDYKTRKNIDFIAYAYNRNGDPHYHGNATIIKDFNFPDKIYLRLDQLDSAKLKDVGNGYGSGGHWTGVDWHRFKYFPAADTVFEVRGLDKLPLKSFYGDWRVYNSSQIQNIFQPSRFSQQETKVHINLDLDTQYTWTQPLLYISNFNYHAPEVSLGWKYDGNDDLLKRTLTEETIITNSYQEYLKIKNIYKIQDSIEEQKIQTFFSKQFIGEHNQKYIISKNFLSIKTLLRIIKTQKFLGNSWTDPKIENSIVSSADITSQKHLLPEAEASGWVLKTSHAKVTKITTNFDSGWNTSYFEIEGKDYYLADEDWALENEYLFVNLIYKTNYFYNFSYYTKTDWLGYQYFIPLTFSTYEKKGYSTIPNISSPFEDWNVTTKRNIKVKYQHNNLFKDTLSFHERKNSSYWIAGENWAQKQNGLKQHNLKNWYEFERAIGVSHIPFSPNQKRGYEGFFTWISFLVSNDGKYIVPIDWE